MNNAYIAIVACAFASGSITAWAADSDAQPPSKSPAQRAWDATDPGNAKSGAATPKDKAKQREVEAARRGLQGAGDSAAASSRPGDIKKTWEEMTPAEQEAARRRWLLNSGDFGRPGGPPRTTPKSLPMTKESQTAVEAAEKAGAPKENAPAK
jgi:hypothetical protein